jgi:glycerophosphoryl diester phosphodiesterase
MGKLAGGKLFQLLVLISACSLLLVGYNEHPAYHLGSKEMLSIAHRGASGYAPENTQAAFKKGLELGADYLEFDVHLSKDGELVIIHDEKVERTTNGKGFVRDFTLAELNELDAGGKFHEIFAGEKILTLNELLEEFYGAIGLLIELKKPDLYPGIEEKLVDLLKEYEDLSGIIVQSFDVESIRKIHNLIPEVEVEVLISPSAKLPSANKINDLTSFATYINFNVTFVNKRIVNKVHKHGGKVMVWSKHDGKLEEKAFQYGADGIITDFTHWPVEMPTFLVKE